MDELEPDPIRIRHVDEVVLVRVLDFAGHAALLVEAGRPLEVRALHTGVQESH
ncbi:MAG: hypothetical protein WA688_04645 [Thermoplasmata archaeon]